MTPPRSLQPERCRGDAGFVGGSESMIFGVLIFVAGTLLLFNAWAVVDAKMAASSAAREAARTYVESDGDPGPAVAAGREAFDATSGFAPDQLQITIDGVFARCQRITVTASYTVPAISLPFGGFGSGFQVTSSHSEIVDPFRSGLDGVALCG